MHFHLRQNLHKLSGRYGSESLRYRVYGRLPGRKLNASWHRQPRGRWRRTRAGTAGDGRIGVLRFNIGLGVIDPKLTAIEVRAIEVAYGGRSGVGVVELDKTCLSS